MIFSVCVHVCKYVFTHVLFDCVCEVLDFSVGGSSMIRYVPQGGDENVSFHYMEEGVSKITDISIM